MSCVRVFRFFSFESSKIFFRFFFSAMISPVTYQSTRGGVKDLKFSEAVLMGLPLDHGLLVPDHIPQIDLAVLEAKSTDFRELALEVMKPFIDPSDISVADLKAIIYKSYATFDDPTVVTPIQNHKGLYVLELFHGPTFAFKVRATD